MKSIGISPILPWRDIFGVDLGALTIFLMMDNCMLNKTCLSLCVGFVKLYDGDHSDLT